MVGEKMVSFSFGGVAGPRLQTPSAGIGKPWVPTRQVGLQAIICRHMTSGPDPHAWLLTQASGSWLSWALRPDPHTWLQTQASGSEDPLEKALALSLASWPNVVVSGMRTHCSWSWSRPISLGSCVRTQVSWVLC